MNSSGSTSRLILLAAWRSPTRPISTPRSAHPCANCRTTPRKSDPSTKSHRSNMPREGVLTYGRINRAVSVNCDYDIVIITARFETEFRPIVESMEGAAGPSDDLSLYKGKKLKVGSIRLGKFLMRVAIYCIEEMGLSPAA